MKFLKSLTKFSTSLFLFLALISCHSEKVETPPPLTQNKETISVPKTTNNPLPKSGTMKLPSGETLRVRLAITMEEQTQGLSGIKDNEFENDEAMLFFYKEDADRLFWMPDTYFNLDIFFIEKDLTVIGIDRDVPFHPGRNTPPRIATTKVHYCRHVLELKSSSPLAKKIKPGDKLSWLSSPTLLEIEANIH